MISHLRQYWWLLAIVGLAAIGLLLFELISNTFQINRQDLRHDLIEVQQATAAANNQVTIRIKSYGQANFSPAYSIDNRIEKSVLAFSPEWIAGNTSIYYNVWNITMASNSATDAIDSRAKCWDLFPTFFPDTTAGQFVIADVLENQPEYHTDPIFNPAYRYSKSSFNYLNYQQLLHRANHIQQHTAATTVTLQWQTEFSYPAITPANEAATAKSNTSTVDISDDGYLLRTTYYSLTYSRTSHRLMKFVISNKKLSAAVESSALDESEIFLITWHGPRLTVPWSSFTPPCTYPLRAYHVPSGFVWAGAASAGFQASVIRPIDNQGTIEYFKPDQTSQKAIANNSYTIYTGPPHAEGSPAQFINNGLKRIHTALGWGHIYTSNTLVQVFLTIHSRSVEIQGPSKLVMAALPRLKLVS